MTVVLDAGGVSMLVGNRARLEELRRRDEWPAVVPAPVLTEVLTGDHRRDFHANRLLRTCDVRAVDEELARAAAGLRTSVVERPLLSAVDAIVVALADAAGGAAVLTSDPDDLRPLARAAVNPVVIGSV